MWTSGMLGGIETEEEILAKQAEFLQRTGNKRTGGQEDGTDGAQCSGDSGPKKQKGDNSKDLMFTAPDALLGFAQNPQLLLGDVVERIQAPSEPPGFFPGPSPQGFPKGFPQAQRRDKALDNKGGSSQSIFARSQGNKASSSPSTAAKPPKDDSSVSSHTQSSRAQEDQKWHESVGSLLRVLGAPEAQKIQQENETKLAEMSEKHILEEQQKLLASMDPALVALLRSRKTTQESQPAPTTKPAAEKPKVVKPKGPVSMEMDFNPEDLPIPLSEASKWLHMDVMESDKLRWMSRLPAPRPHAHGQAYTARFAFDGTLLAPDAVMPESSALFHHGDEPERPGYSLEELLLLSRSSVLQQRALGLSTIANVLSLAKSGRLDTCLQETIVPQLLNAGLFAALRFSLDESTPMVHEAAAKALANLLCSKPDEICLGQLLGTGRGLQQPRLSCPALPKEHNEEAEIEGELKDHELLLKDVVKGTLRTNILLRIRYLLQEVKPGPNAVLSLLEVLIRIARHSRDSALQIQQCPGLLAIIVSSFVPTTWERSFLAPSAVTNVYGVPLSAALRLLRVIASHSRPLALNLVKQHKIMKPLLAYLSEEPSETGIPGGGPLLLEAIYLWQTLLTYGLTAQELKEYSPVLYRMLGFHWANTQLENTIIFGQEHAVALLGLVSTGAHIQEIAGSLLGPLGLPILRAAAAWLAQASHITSLTWSAQKLLGAAVRTVAILFKALLHHPDVDSVMWLGQLEVVVAGVLGPFLASPILETLVTRLSDHSCLLNASSISGWQRDHAGLPSLGSVTWGQEIAPALRTSSPFPLLIPLSEFLVSAAELLPYLRITICSLLDSPGITSYMTLLAKQGCPGSPSWFSRWEAPLPCVILTLANYSCPENLPKRFFHSAALMLLPAVSDRLAVKNLMQSWIFNQQAFEEELTAGLFDTLRLESSPSWPQETQMFLKQAYDRLPEVSSLYSMWANAPEKEKEQCLAVVARGGEVLPRDWIFLPLIIMADQAYSGVNELTWLSEAERCLHWLLLLEVVRSEDLQRLVSPTARFCRFCCLYVTGNDLFLDQKVKNIAKVVLAAIIRSSKEKFDFTESIPGLNSFWELFVSLVKEFVAISYCDPTFSNVVLVPLQQIYNPEYRLHVWGEQAVSLRSLTLTPDQLVIDMKNFLEPPEQNVEMLGLYLRALKSGTVHKGSVVAIIATYHVNWFAQHGENADRRDKMVTALKKLPQTSVEIMESSKWQ